MSNRIKSTVETIEADPESARLTAVRTFVLYRDSDYSGSQKLFVSAHDVDAGIVGPGQWIEPGDYLSEMDKLNRPEEAEANKPSWMPYRILSIGRNHLMWHVPSSKRYLNFTEPRMRKLSGEYKIPALIFRTDGRDLYCHAVKASVITPTTPLYKVPLPNFFTEGRICLGSMPTFGCAPSDAEKWTSAYFDSAFTHAAYIETWKAAKKGKPIELKPANKKVKDL